MTEVLLIEDEALRPASLKLVQELRTKGFAVEYPLTPAKSDKQFKRAQELKVVCTAKLEKSPGEGLLARVRNLKSRSEKTGPLEKTPELLKELTPKDII